jgi:hypothetical protein
MGSDPFAEIDVAGKLRALETSHKRHEMTTAERFDHLEELLRHAQAALDLILRTLKVDEAEG